MHIGSKSVISQPVQKQPLPPHPALSTSLRDGFASGFEEADAIAKAQKQRALALALVQRENERRAAADAQQQLAAHEQQQYQEDRDRADGVIRATSTRSSSTTPPGWAARQAKCLTVSTTEWTDVFIPLFREGHFFQTGNGALVWSQDARFTVNQNDD